jgi:hypothetical protein
MGYFSTMFRHAVKLTIPLDGLLTNLPSATLVPLVLLLACINMAQITQIEKRVS